METNPRFGQVLRFGPFEVNLSTGELRKRGIRLPMQEQPLRILAALVERPGEVVSREDLCRRLWPGGTFVDFEHSLNAAVRRLRVALGDEAETPRFIETVHRRGYRFLAWSQTLPRIEEAWRLAVRPFVSFDGGDAHRVFSDGLTEETITQLARACPAHVGVIARTSVMRLRGSQQSAAEIGRVLGADYLVEGSIRREGDRLRIVAQLIESRDETHLWAATFDRVLGDELTLQADVADHIAREVAGVLSGRAPLASREAAS